MNTPDSAIAPIIFNFQGNLELRVIVIDDEPWFVAIDVAEILGYKDTEAMTRRLDEDEVQNLQIVGFGNRGINIINESGLYSAILGSNKPEAKQFKRWLTHEVLPSIRKHGYYLGDNFGLGDLPQHYPPGYPPHVPPFQRINATVYTSLRKTHPQLADAYLAESGITASYVEEQLAKIAGYAGAIKHMPPNGVVLLTEAVPQFLADWESGTLQAPNIPCTVKQLARLFGVWRRANNLKIAPYDSQLTAAVCNHGYFAKNMWHKSQKSQKQVRVILPSGFVPAHGMNKHEWLGQCIAEMEMALRQLEGKP